MEDIIRELKEIHVILGRLNIDFSNDAIGHTERLLFENALDSLKEVIEEMEGKDD